MNFRDIVIFVLKITLLLKKIYHRFKTNILSKIGTNNDCFLSIWEVVSFNLSKGGKIMDKKSYYVSVQSKTVSEKTDDTSHPIEVLATTEELSELIALFNTETDEDEAAFVRMPITTLLSRPEVRNQVYDTYLIRIYKTLYDLGTLKTREFIKTMGILD
jgi:hypothetical protein